MGERREGVERAIKSELANWKTEGPARGGHTASRAHKAGAGVLGYETTYLTSQFERLI